MVKKQPRMRRPATLEAALPKCRQTNAGAPRGCRVGRHQRRQPYRYTSTRVPYRTQRNTDSASGVGIRRQPWLAGYVGTV